MYFQGLFFSALFFLEAVAGITFPLSISASEVLQNSLTNILQSDTSSSWCSAGSAFCCSCALFLATRL